ncbi:MAG: DUF1801 domain-containing protein [Cyclobacteriaceae bacterium]
MTVDEFLYELPDTERRITQKVREIILECGPRLREKLSYGVPYYSQHRRVCFIWPSSIANGPVGGLTTIGFCHGTRLSNKHRLLSTNGRKQVSTMALHSVHQIDEIALKETIIEALLLDESLFKN